MWWPSSGRLILHPCTGPYRVPSRLLGLALALALAACGEVAVPGQVGQTAPSYAATTMSHDSVSLEKLRGDAVLLNVWATWCAPCRKEIPELEALHQRLAGRGLRVIGVSIDAAGTDEAIRGFADDMGMTYEIWRDPDDRIASAFRLQGVPTTFLIGRDGEILWRHVGPVTQDDRTLQQALSRTLNGDSGT